MPHRGDDRFDVDNIHLIDSTLREGAQHGAASFSDDDRMSIARALDSFGLDYIELGNPLSSPVAQRSFTRIASLGLKAKCIAHIRCRAEDASSALAAGARCVNVFLGVSPQMKAYSHGMDMRGIMRAVEDVLSLIYIRAPQTEICFSAEDAFRANRDELFSVMDMVARMGVTNRLGLADTVGTAEPFGVYALVRDVIARTAMEVKFHGHNDTGCAVANSYAAMRAGARHIDVSIFGIGERNGIASLAGVMARMMADDPLGMAKKYRLTELGPLHEMVARMLGISVPEDHPIVGGRAFTHKAGVHVNAVLNNPVSYEPFSPDMFGLKRDLIYISDMSGWRAVRQHARRMGVEMTDEQAMLAASRMRASQT